FPTPITSNQGDIRIDQNIGSAQTFFGRFTYKHKDDTRLPSGGTDPSSTNGSALAGGFQIPENDWSITGAHNWVINPQTANEFRAGWTGYNLTRGFSVVGSEIEDQLSLTPYIQQSRDFLTKVRATPNFRITGFQNTGGGSSQRRTSTYQFLDNLTWVHSTHAVKVGGDLRYLKALYTSVFDTLWLGSYTFNTSGPGRTIGSPFAAFLLGVPTSSRIATVLYPDTDAYGKAYAFYAQDDWKIT